MVAPAVGAALVSGGASILGGLFGRRKKNRTQKTVTTNEIDYKKIVKDSKAAGFNPLTALRNGGSAMGSTTSTTTAPPMSSGEFVADAIRAGFGAWNDAKEVQRDTVLRELEAELVRAEIDAMKEQSSRDVLADRNFGYSIPHITQAPPAAGGNTVPSTLIEPDKNVRNVPLHSAPTTVMRDDGLTGSNPDAPREAETDMFQWAIDGTIIDNVNEIARRNGLVIPDAAKATRDWLQETIGAPSIPAWFYQRGKRGAGGAAQDNAEKYGRRH